MNRIIKNIFLTLLVQQFCTAEAFIDETCELNRELEQQCRSYTHSVVKPMLDYLRRVNEELQESKAKDEIIKDLREKLVQQNMDETLIKELRSQIDFQKRIDSLTESNKKCEVELASKTMELEILDVEMKKLNASLLEKNKETAKINVRNNTEIEKLQSQKDLQKQTMKIEKDIQLYKAENDQVNRTFHNYRSDCSAISGIQTINVPDFGLLEVLCGTERRLVILHHVFKEKESLNRDWATYREGFGDRHSEFFLGLEKIHRLTRSRRHEAFIYITNRHDSFDYHRYDDFKISDENSGYAVHLGEISGAYSIAKIKLYEGMKFTTYDRNNDNHKNNCASEYKFGWWYNGCSRCRGTRCIRAQEFTMMIRPIAETQN